MAAEAVFSPDVVSEYGGVPCVALVWVETLEPMYCGHPGSAWPVIGYRRRGDGVDLVGPRGMATVRAVPGERRRRLEELATVVGHVRDR